MARSFVSTAKGYDSFTLATGQDFGLVWRFWNLSPIGLGFNRWMQQIGYIVRRAFRLLVGAGGLDQFRGVVFAGKRRADLLDALTNFVECLVEMHVGCLIAVLNDAPF